MVRVEKYSIVSDETMNTCNDCSVEIRWHRRYCDKCREFRARESRIRRGLYKGGVARGSITAKAMVALEQSEGVRPSDLVAVMTKKQAAMVLRRMFRLGTITRIRPGVCGRASSEPVYRINLS